MFSTRTLCCRLTLIIACLAGLGAGLLPGIVSEGGVAWAQTTAANYLLGPGDKLRVTVFGHTDLSGEFEVDGSGQVSLPLIRNLNVQGKTVRETEEMIAARLKPEYLLNPQVSVEVINYRPFFIFGEVNKPGSYPYVNGMTIINAVALAGGYTYRARQNKARITRATDPTKAVQDATPDAVVLPGDVIEIPERYF